MLQAIRSKSGSLLVKGLFGILIVTFGIWGIGDIFRDRGPNTTVATVDGEEISADALQRALQPTLERLSIQTGGSVGVQQARKLGIVDAVLGRLIDRATLDREATRLQLDVSDEVLRGAITQNPGFRDAKGTFDRTTFNAMLAANHLTEAQYVAQLRRDIPRTDLLLAVTAGARGAPEMVAQLYRYRGEKRVADILSLPISAAGAVGQPSASDIEAYYEAHKESFRAPEYRSFSLASLTPSELARNIEVPEATLQQEYDRRRAEFVIPERRNVEEMLAPSEEAAKKAEAALAAGKDWKQVAGATAGQNPGTVQLGLMTRAEMPREFAAIAFGLPVDKPSAPIKTPLGWRILRVVKIDPPANQSFAEAKPKLAAQIAHDEAVRRIYKIADQVDDALAGGATLDEAAKKFGLKKTLVTAVDDQGLGRDGKKAAIPVAPAAVVKAAFATQEGQTSAVTETDDDALYVLRTDKIMPPSIKSLAEVKSTIVTEWQAAQRAKTVDAQGARLAASVKPGLRLAAIANASGLKVSTSPAFMRRPSADDRVPQVLIPKLFAAKPGEVVTASDAAGSYVAQLDKIEVPSAKTADASAKTEIDDELTQGLQADLTDEFSRALRARFPVEIDHDALNRYF